jgi:hypothetical protein
MKCKTAAITLVCIVAACAQASSGLAGGMTIKVIDEHNKGVYSRVYYNDGTEPPPFWNTDQKGDVPQPPPTCGKMRTLHAHPFDSGAYFDSTEEPCASKVVLRVLSRQTPKGQAIKYEIFSVTLSDGSEGVLTVKAALDSNFVNKSTAGVTHCEVRLDASADQQLFKVDGETWKNVAETTTPFSNVFAGSDWPDTQTVTAQGPCTTAGRKAQKEAIYTLSKRANKDSIKMEAFRALGLEPQLKVK